MRTTRSITIAITILAVTAQAVTAQATPTPPAGARPMPGAGGPGLPQAPGVLAGTVVNEAGQPVAAASVAVRRLRDTVLVNGAIGQANGTFRVEGLPPGRYSVRIRAMGFAPLIRNDVVITPADPRVEMGRVTVMAVATQITGTTVTAEREAAALAPDRNTYSVKDMPTAAGGTTVDVLRNVPGVEVDADNRVSLRGNQNVVVQINGRATPMRGEQLGNFLAQLSSTLVQRVEVVPNPSAKDDPEGMAGILNIVLKQNADLGTSAGLTLATSTTKMVNASGNVGHQQGPLTLFGSYGFMRDERHMTGYMNRQNLFMTPTTFLDSDNVGEMFPLSHNVTGQAEYKVTPKDVLSTNVLFSKRRFDRANDNFYREMDAARVVTNRYDRFTDAESRDLTADFAVNFKRTTERLRREASAEFRVNRSTTDFGSAYLDQAYTAAGAPTTNQPLRQNDDLAERRTEYTLQTDVVRPFGARGKFEFGYKGQARGLDNDFEASRFAYGSGAGGGTFVRDPARSNAFDYQDQVHAAYAVLSRSMGKVSMQGGLRAEQAFSNFDLATTNESYDNDYRSLYPSALVSYAMSQTTQLKASYSKRVQRPDTRQMNPFIFREDALNIQQGNPQLQPEYTHAMELGYQTAFSRGSMQVTPFFRHTVDAVRAIRSIDAAGVSKVTFANVATSDSYGADLNGSFRLGGFNGFGGFSLFRSVTDASNLTTDVSNEALGWNARVNGSYKLTPRLDAQGFLMYRAPQNVEGGRVLAHSMMMLALRQRVLGDRGSVTLRAQDPFNMMRFGFEQADGRVVQNSLRRMGARGLFVNFSYNYGQAPRLKPVEQAAPSDPSPSPIGGP